MSGKPNWLQRASHAAGPSVQIMLAVALGLAVIGFFVGTHKGVFKGRELAGYAAPPERPAYDVQPARTYSELFSQPFSVNAALTRSIPKLQEQQLANAAPPDAPSPQAKAMAIQERQQRRAYDAAPPTIPHPVRQRNDASCMACHEQGVRLEGKLASPMSHNYLANCTQCHVPSESPQPFAERAPEALPRANDFVSLTHQERWAPAYPGAPPVMPHTTVMRERCQSCHGYFGREGLRTTHPERQNCTQCHAPGAELDQRATMPLPDIGAER